jgi:hypothetical protein
MEVPQITSAVSNPNSLKAWITTLWFIPNPQPEQAVLGIFRARKYSSIKLLE